MEQSARFALPYLSPGQAQKEWFHNEALQRIDMLICAAVDGVSVNDPPPAPQPGDCFLLGDQPTGGWAGQAGRLAGYSDGGWRFLAPAEGMRLLVRSTGETMVRLNGGWETGIVRASEVQVGGTRVVGPRQSAIAAPSGGTVVDGEARTAIVQILAALQAHGLVEAS